MADDGKPHTVTLLSEKPMCQSCLEVMADFKKRYQNVTVEAVSYNESKRGTKSNKVFEFDVKRKYENENTE